MMEPVRVLDPSAPNAPGEILASNLDQASNINSTSFESLGNIQVVEKSLIDASGDGGGTVRVRGGQLVLENDSDIFADNTGTADARGGVSIEAEAITIASGSQVTAAALGSGRAGSVTVKADRLRISREGSELAEGEASIDAGLCK